MSMRLTDGCVSRRVLDEREFRVRHEQGDADRRADAGHLGHLTEASTGVTVTNGG